MNEEFEETYLAFRNQLASNNRKAIHCDFDPILISGGTFWISDDKCMALTLLLDDALYRVFVWKAANTDRLPLTCRMTGGSLVHLRRSRAFSDRSLERLRQTII